MKNYCIILIFCAFLMFSNCRQNIDYEVEVKAIKEVIMEETNAYSAQDYPRLIKTLVHDSTSVRMSTGRLEHKEMLGWEEIEPYYKKCMEADWSDYKILNRDWSDWKVKVYDKCAWAIFKVHTMYSYQEQEGETNTSEVRFLEKDNGDWRIVYYHWVDLSSYEEEEQEEE